MAFKDRLKQIRTEKGVAMKDIAADLGMTYNGFQHYESRGTEPNYATLAKISCLLGVSIDELLQDELDGVMIWK